MTIDREGVKLCAQVSLALALALALALWATHGLPYSHGRRDGVVSRFSRRGLLSRTWEGEMAAGGGAWRFSVHDDRPDIAAELDSLKPGEIVRLHYRRALWVSPLVAETANDVHRVERIRQQ